MHRFGQPGPPARREPGVKLVVAVVKPFKLDDVKDVLKELGVQGLTMTEVQGFGRQRGSGGRLSVRGRGTGPGPP